MMAEIVWISEWCLERGLNASLNGYQDGLNPNSPDMELIAANFTNPEKHMWLKRCVTDRQHLGPSQVLPYLHRRWCGHERWSHKLILSLYVANVFVWTALWIHWRAYKRLTAKDQLWSPVVFAQMILGPEFALGLSDASQFFIANHFLVGVLSNRAMLLFSLLDRIQAFRDPIEFKMSGRAKRVFLMLLVSYGLSTGLVAVMSVLQSRRQLATGRRKTWQINLCDQAGGLATFCKAPLFDDGVDQEGVPLGAYSYWWGGQLMEWRKGTVGLSYAATTALLPAIDVAILAATFASVGPFVTRTAAYSKKENQHNLRIARTLIAEAVQCLGITAVAVALVSLIVAFRWSTQTPIAEFIRMNIAFPGTMGAAVGQVGLGTFGVNLLLCPSFRAELRKEPLFQIPRLYVVFVILAVLPPLLLVFVTC